MKLKSLILGACAAALIAGSSVAAHAEGFAGLLTGKKRLAPITLASGKPLAEKPYELESGRYYSIDLVSDGSAELAIEDLGLDLDLGETGQHLLDELAAQGARLDWGSRRALLAGSSVGWFW